MRARFLSAGDIAMVVACDVLLVVVVVLWGVEELDGVVALPVAALAALVSIATMVRAALRARAGG